MSSNGLANGYGVDGTTTNAGSHTNPYAIRDAADLNAMSSSNWGNGVCYNMTNDIDLNGATYSSKSDFLGIFNGKGYTIKNSNKSIFNTISQNSMVCNVKLYGFNINFTIYDYRGCLCNGNSGYSYRNVSYVNCSASNCTMTASSGYANTCTVGILIGRIDNGTIYNCNVTDSTITGKNSTNCTIYCGGLCGTAYSSYGTTSILNCHAENITFTGSSGVGISRAGGLICIAYSELFYPSSTGYYTGAQTNISNCYIINCTSSNPDNTRCCGIISNNDGACIVSCCYVYNLTSTGTTYGIAYDESTSYGHLVVNNCAAYGGTIGSNTLTNKTQYIANSFSSSDVSIETFKSRGFWDSNYSNLCYLQYDFDNTWVWDSSKGLPVFPEYLDSKRVYVKVNGAWKQSSATLVKVNGAWKS